MKVELQELLKMCRLGNPELFRDVLDARARTLEDTLSVAHVINEFLRRTATKSNDLKTLLRTTNRACTEIFFMIVNY
jgi:hypothetical protein